MTEAFEKLIGGLSDSQKVDFFRTMQETGISKDDNELAKLLRVLQIYRSYYETIPDSIQKTISSIKELTRQATQSAESGKKSLNQLIHESIQVDESMKKIHTHVEDAAIRASDVVSKHLTATMESTLADLAETGQFFSDTIASNRQQAAELLEEANRVFSDSATLGKQASSELRKNIRSIRWSHYRAYAIASLVAFLGLWACMQYRYEKRMDREYIAIVKQVEDNREILLELARGRRNLELSTRQNGTRLLSIKNATGWTSIDNYGVLELK